MNTLTGIFVGAVLGAIVWGIGIALIWWLLL
jgi:hypothetical protein